MVPVILTFYYYTELYIRTHFVKHITFYGFFPKLTRPTRSFENTHKLVDNMLTNNICKPQITGILTHRVSDYFMFFCIVEGKIMRTKAPLKIEILHKYANI